MTAARNADCCRYLRTGRIANPIDALIDLQLLQDFERHRWSDHVSVAEKAKTVIDSTYSQKHTLREISKTIGTSRAVLDKIFRQRHGTRVHGYLTSVRVTNGLNLIEAGSKIEAAALAVGYRSRKDFYSAVFQITRRTPAQFAKERRSSSVVTGVSAV